MQVLVLSRLRGQRAIYGVLLDARTSPGTILGVTEALPRPADRRRFLAGALPADPTRAAWGRRQRWAFPPLGFGTPPGMEHEAAPPPIPARATYRHELVRCGKSTCSRCRTGPGHGPYWYAYWHEAGFLRKRYLGKTFIPPAPPTSTIRSLPDSPVMNNPG